MVSGRCPRTTPAKKCHDAHRWATHTSTSPMSIAPFHVLLAVLFAISAHQVADAQSRPAGAAESSTTASNSAVESTNSSPGGSAGAGSNESDPVAGRALGEPSTSAQAPSQPASAPESAVGLEAPSGSEHRPSVMFDAALPAEAGPSNLVLLLEPEPGTLLDALRAELRADGLLVELAPFPEGSTGIQRAAAAQQMAIEQRARAAIWIEPTPRSSEVIVVASNGQAPRRSQIPDVPAASSARVVAVVAASLLNDVAAPPAMPAVPAAPPQTARPWYRHQAGRHGQTGSASRLAETAAGTPAEEPGTPWIADILPRKGYLRMGPLVAITPRPDLVLFCNNCVISDLAFGLRVAGGRFIGRMFRLEAFGTLIEAVSHGLAGSFGVAAMYSVPKRIRFGIGVAAALMVGNVSDWDVGDYGFVGWELQLPIEFTVEVGGNSAFSTVTGLTVSQPGDTAIGFGGFLGMEYEWHRP